MVNIRKKITNVDLSKLKSNRFKLIKDKKDIEDGITKINTQMCSNLQSMFMDKIASKYNSNINVYINDLGSKIGIKCSNAETSGTSPELTSEWRGVNLLTCTPKKLNEVFSTVESLISDFKDFHKEQQKVLSKIKPNSNVFLNTKTRYFK